MKLNELETETIQEILDFAIANLAGNNPLLGKAIEMKESLLETEMAFGPQSPNWENSIESFLTR
jgi:hypothetical protein